MSERTFKGQKATLADVEQELGTKSTWGQAAARVAERNAKARAIIRVAPREVADLARHPKYVTHCLRHCARQVLEAPRAVFEGLRRAGLDSAKAYCGKPIATYDNDGRAYPAPEGMVYVVYTDRDGAIFDWDWVKADPHDLSLPLEHATRFARRVEKPVPSRLAEFADPVVNIFDSSRGVYSDLGDCIFAYFADSPAYAARVNEDLTIFRALTDGEPVGCKVKNIRAIMSRLEPGETWTSETREFRVAVVVARSYARHAEAGSPPHGYTEVFKAFENVAPHVLLPQLAPPSTPPAQLSR